MIAEFMFEETVTLARPRCPGTVADPPPAAQKMTNAVSCCVSTDVRVVPGTAQSIPDICKRVRVPHVTEVDGSVMLKLMLAVALG